MALRWVVMEIDGLPLHPLIVHAVVVFAPLSALFALGYVVPRWRGALRWPLILSAVVATASAVVAAYAGEQLMNDRGLDALPAVQDHQDRGELLRNVLLGFLVVTGLALWRLPGHDQRERSGGAVRAGVTVLLAVGAVAVLICAFLAGDSGARAVWEL